MKIRARVMTIVFVLIVATIAIVNAAMPKRIFLKMRIVCWQSFLS